MGPALAERTYLEWGRHLRGQAIHRYSERATDPDWTELDLGVRYTTAIYDKKTIFRANVQNVTAAAGPSGASFGPFYGMIARQIPDDPYWP